VEIGYDTECDQGGSTKGDGDIADAGDDIQIDDDFSSNVMSLSYDNNGNLTLDTPPLPKANRSLGDRAAMPRAASQGLTDDSVYKFEYDAWNP